MVGPMDPLDGTFDSLIMQPPELIPRTMEGRTEQLRKANARLERLETGRVSEHGGDRVDSGEAAADNGNVGAEKGFFRGFLPTLERRGAFGTMMPARPACGFFIAGGEPADTAEADTAP